MSLSCIAHEVGQPVNMPNIPDRFLGLPQVQTCAKAARRSTIRRPATEQQTQTPVSAAVTADAAAHGAPAAVARGEARGEVRDMALPPTRKRRPPVRLLETDWSTERALASSVPSLKRKRQQPPQPDADTPVCTAGTAQPAAPAAALASPTAAGISAGHAAACAQRPAGQGGGTSHAGVCCQSGQVNIGTRDCAARPAFGDATAAASARVSALQKQAWVELAARCGCSRAVPRHAVAVLASLRDSNTAVPGRGSVIPADASTPITRLHVTAGCWRHHAEQRGCARAVSRAAVTSLVDLLRRAGDAAEPSQVSLPRHLFMPLDDATQKALAVGSPAHETVRRPSIATIIT